MKIFRIKTGHATPVVLPILLYLRRGKKVVMVVSMYVYLCPVVYYIKNLYRRQCNDKMTVCFRGE